MIAEAPQRLPRVPFVHPVRVGPTEGRSRRLWAENVSTGGMFILTGKPYNKGMRLRVSLESPEGLVTIGEGEVVWERSSPATGGRSGFGLRFVDMEPSAKALLAAVVKHGGSHHAPMTNGPKTGNDTEH